MMGVYINMEMPRNCRQCSLYLQSMDSERNVYENCAVTAKSYNWGLTTRPSDCPLVHVPPHGRLIDADAFLKLCMDYAVTPNDDEFCKRLEYALTKATTVIPIDPAEEGE